MTTLPLTLKAARFSYLPALRFTAFGLLAVLVAFLVGFPIAALVYRSFEVSAPGEAVEFGLAQWRAAWVDPDVPLALWNTLRLTVIRMLIAFVVAYVLAWLVVRTNMPGSQWIEYGFWFSFFMPPLTVVQAWIFLLERDAGLINRWIAALPFVEVSPFEVFSFWGIVWVHLMSSSITVVFIFLSLALRHMDAQLEEASRVCGGTNLTTAVRITLPLMKPMIAMVLILGFIRGLQSFEIERVLGQPVGIHVYATLVVDMITHSHQPRLGQGVALSAFVLACLAPLMIFYRVFLGRRSYATISSRIKPLKVNLGIWRWPALVLVITVVLLLTVVPGFALLVGSFMTRWGYFDIPNTWTLNHWKVVLANPLLLQALKTSLLLGIVSAGVSTVLVFLVAYVIVRMRFAGRTMLDVMSWLPWAMPGVLLSLGILIMVLYVPALRFFHGTLFALILAMTLFRFPLGVQLLKTGIMQISTELEEASRVAGASWWRTQWRIMRLLLTPMLIVVALLTFISAINEVSGIVMLAGVGTQTLSLMALDFITGGRFKEAAAIINIIIMALGVGTALVARRFGLHLTPADLNSWTSTSGDLRTRPSDPSFRPTV